MTRKEVSMSSSSGSSHLPIKEADVAVQKKSVSALIANVGWAPRVQLTDLSGGSKEFAAGSKAWRPALAGASSKQEELSLLKIGRALSQDANLMSENANTVLLAIQQALCIGLYLGQQYAKAVGLLELQQLNSSSQLAGTQKAEFSAKQNTAAAITVFCTACYISWRLGSYKESDVSAMQVEFHGVPELDLKTPVTSVKCFLFYLAAYLDPERTKLVWDDLSMVKMVLLYCTATLDEVKHRESSFQHADPFTEASYQLEGTDFIVSGFDVLKQTVAVSAEFRRISFGEIVGNQAAKHSARRLAARLACYDRERKKNPFAELGSLQTVVMGFGKPGTGKTLLIGATATEIENLCSRIGLPFVFWPLPDTVISTFQGGSGERMWDWMKRFQDDDKIVYGPIDDGENNLEDRTRQGVSAGVREVIGVFLRGTEGASAMLRGNSVVAVYTNLPEQLDKAVLSRVQARYPIDGAVSAHDFIDQDYLWWKKIRDIDPAFITMTDPADYQFMADQVVLQRLAESSDVVGELADERLREAYRLICERYQVTEHAFFGALYAAVARIYPTFSSRDVRNIQQAVQSRLMDFDLPADWIENPKLFYLQAYERKVEMLKDHMRQNMGGLSFADIRHEEALRYLNALDLIVNADRERQIVRLMEATEIQHAAQCRMAGKP